MQRAGSVAQLPQPRSESTLQCVKRAIELGRVGGWVAWIDRIYMHMYIQTERVHCRYTPRTVRYTYTGRPVGVRGVYGPFWSSKPAFRNSALETTAVSWPRFEPGWLAWFLLGVISLRGKYPLTVMSVDRLFSEYASRLEDTLHEGVEALETEAGGSVAELPSETGQLSERRRFRPLDALLYPLTESHSHDATFDRLNECPNRDIARVEDIPSQTYVRMPTRRSSYDSVDPQTVVCEGILHRTGLHTVQRVHAHTYTPDERVRRLSSSGAPRDRVWRRVVGCASSSASGARGTYLTSGKIRSMTSEASQSLAAARVCFVLH